MPEMQIGPAGIATKFDLQRLLQLEGFFDLADEFLLGNNFGGTPFYDVDLFVESGKQLLLIS